MLRTSRCIIRNIQDSDEAFYFQLQKTKKIREFLWWIQSDEHIASRFSKILWDPNSYWAIIRNDTNEKIWIISIDTHCDVGWKELSYEFDDSSWWKWYAFESISEILKFASEKLNINEIIAETQSKNAKSRVLLDKLWFTLKEEIIRHWEKQKVYLKSLT